MNNRSIQTNRGSGLDQTILTRQLITVGLVACTIVAAFYSVKMGSIVYIAALIALPFALMLMTAPTLALVMALILNATMIPVPGLKASQLGLLAQIILVATYCLGLFMGKLQWKTEKLPEHRLVKFYLVLLVVIIAVRGTGLRVFGSETWGGTKYIYQFVAIMMYFMLSGFRLNKKAIRWIIWGSLVAGLIGSLFLWRTGDRFALDYYSDVNRGRLAFLRPLYLALLPVAFALKFKHAKWVSMLLFLTCIGLIGLTGFRSFLVGGLVMIGGYGFFRAQHKIWYSFAMILVGLCGWGLMVGIGPSLPLGLQRAVSFLPGVQVAGDVTANAAHSVEWRLELWRDAIEYAGRDYLLIGRGLTFNVMEVVQNAEAGNELGTATQWFMYEMHSYHSGPLTMLIDFGLAGLIFHIIFTIMVFKRVWGYAVQMAKLNTMESRYALFACVTLLWDLFSFYTVYGSAERIAFEIIGYALVTVYVKSVLDMHRKDTVKITTEVPNIAASTAPAYV